MVSASFALICSHVSSSRASATAPADSQVPPTCLFLLKRTSSRLAASFPHDYHRLWKSSNIFSSDPGEFLDARCQARKQQGQSVLTDGSQHSTKSFRGKKKF